MPGFKNLAGHRFGRLLVESRAESKITPSGRKRTRWNCKCDCGNSTVVYADALIHGTQVSCGCYKKERLSAITKTHGKTNTRLYSVWCGIRRRCYNPNCAEYSYYGERGIVMCDSWYADFNSFYDWAMDNGYDENGNLIMTRTYLQ